MKLKFVLMTLALLAMASAPVLAQVQTRTGSIYGKTLDDKGAPLPGVMVTLESAQTPPQTATTGDGGTFRFANLQPGTYTATFALQGFTQLQQEDIRVNVGSQVQLEMTMKPTLTEQTVVVAQTPVVDTRQTGQQTTFDRSYMDKVPSGRDPWTMIEQTPGVDNDRINVAGSESGQQTGFFARGASDADNVWNYDGVNATDPLALGASPTYYDFEAFDEITIQNAGMDASVGGKGVVVNLVTKRAGNKWEANASTYYTDHNLQGNNTPQELVSQGVLRSNRINQIYDWGFDAGGPIIKDKLFAWGAYRRQEIDLFTRVTNPFTGESLQDNTTLKDINAKVNFNFNPANESQFGYFNGIKEKFGRGFNPPIQAEETLWHQGSPGTIPEGIITAQHTFVPNDTFILNARYGYIGLSFNLQPNGGDCGVGVPCAVPMIFLAAVPLFEQTSYNVNPIDRPAHDFNIDTNVFKENWAGGDHEFKFGFEYKINKAHSFSSYGNGLLIEDYYQTTPGGPLTSGYIYAQHYIDGHVRYDQTAAYATDTWRMKRLTLNLGARLESASGKNLASNIPGIPGFESIVGPLDFPGNDRSKRFTNVSPRLGATFDVGGDGKTVIRGNYARYYTGYRPFFDQYSNPTYVYNGAIIPYTNLNGDRDITINEVDQNNVTYYGGLNGPIFDLNAFYNSRQIDPNLSSEVTDEFVAGVEKEIVHDLAVSATFTHRKYGNFIADIPAGVTAADFVPGGVFHADTTLGTFDVPYDVLNFTQNGDHLLTNISGYDETYNGVDLGARKRMSNNFMLNAFVTLQRQKAHYNGGNSFFIFPDSGITLRTIYADPSAVNQFFNDQPYAYASGGSGKTGVFPYAEWALRVSGVYQLPANFSVGSFIRYQQGYLQPLFGQVQDDTLQAFYGQQRLILLEPFGSRRYPNIFTLDLNVQKVFELANYGRLTISADAFNVTNNNAVLQRERRVNVSTFNALQENLSPRAFRIGFKYSF